MSGKQGNTRVVWNQVSVLSVTLSKAISSGAHRNVTTVVHVRDHEVQMESGAVRRRRLTRVRVQREAVQHSHNFIYVYVGQPLIVATLLHWYPG